MTATAKAELASIVSRHGAEIRRLERARDELRDCVPASTIEVIDGAAKTSLALVVELQRLVGGIER